jgi:hypothetical protein
LAYLPHCDSDSYSISGSLLRLRGQVLYFDIP